MRALSTEKPLKKFFGRKKTKTFFKIGKTSVQYAKKGQRLVSQGHREKLIGKESSEKCDQRINKMIKRCDIQIIVEQGKAMPH